MTEQRVTVATREGPKNEATANIVFYGKGQRVVRAIAVLTLFLILTGAFIFVPIVHFITTWALPVAGLIGFWMLLRTTAVVKSIEGQCPDCSHDFAFKGGPMEEIMWYRCEQCRLPLKVLFS
jgi:hypothetical protein